MVTLNLLHNKREPVKHECGPITQYQLHGEFEVLLWHNTSHGHLSEEFMVFHIF